MTLEPNKIKYDQLGFFRFKKFRIKNDKVFEKLL